MISLGFVSATLADLSLEEVLAFADAEAFAGVELMCWPKGRAERRFASSISTGSRSAHGRRVAGRKEPRHQPGEVRVVGYGPASQIEGPRAARSRSTSFFIRSRRCSTA